MTSLLDRLQTEAEFHDQMVEQDTRWTGFREYGLSSASIEYAFELVRNANGKVFVDMGCGAGERTIPLLFPETQCYAFDISFRMAAEAQDRLRSIADEIGCTISCQQMAGEQLAFAANSVDVVFGISVIHHLDLTLAYSEISRVLKPGGRGIFVEPLDHHPIAKMYRMLTPSRHTETEKPLRYDDFEIMEKYFSEVHHKEFYLFSLISAIFGILKNKKLFDLSLRILMRFDDYIFSHFPRLRKYAWITVCEAVK